MYWSVHQYQNAMIGAPKSIPVHGKSGSLIGLNILKKSSGSLLVNPEIPPTSFNPNAVIRTAPSNNTPA